MKAEIYDGKESALVQIPGIINRYITRKGLLVKKTNDGAKYLIIRPTLSAGKYPTFISNGRQYYVHRIVWTLFKYGSMSGYNEAVKTIDGDYADISFDRLVIRKNTGRNAKFDPWEIRRAFLMGHSIETIIRTYDISKEYASLMLNGFDKLPGWVKVEIGGKDDRP